MIWIVGFTLALLVLTSIGIIITNNIRKAVLLSGVLSIIASFVYLLLHAPDVALAEAVIGCTLSTIIMLMAIKDLKVIYVFYYVDDLNERVLEKIFSELYTHVDYNVEFTANKEDISENLEKYPHIHYYVYEAPQAIYIYHRGVEDCNPEILKRFTPHTKKPIEIVEVGREV